MIIDGVIIFVTLLIAVIQSKRGFFKSAFDLAAAIISLRLTYTFQKYLATFFFNKVGLSPEFSGSLSAILIFTLFFLIIHFIGVILYDMTLFSIGEGFEQPIAFLLGIGCSLVIFRLLLIIIMSFVGNETLKNIVIDSTIGNEIYTLSFWHFLMDKLKPLMHPGELYL